jgi:hypothetical protein
MLSVYSTLPECTKKGYLLSIWKNSTVIFTGRRILNKCLLVNMVTYFNDGITLYIEPIQNKTDVISVKHAFRRTIKDNLLNIWKNSTVIFTGGRLLDKCLLVNMVTCLNDRNTCHYTLKHYKIRLMLLV